MTNTINKKLKPQSFDLSLRKPNVLLLGNGLCRGYNADSWNKFLNQVNRKKNEFPVPDDIDMPMPLKIILLTENHVGTAMRENKEYFLKEFNETLDSEIYTQINKLFDCGFDYILTTNYSYELEYAVYGDRLSENRLKSIQRYIDTERAENKYMLHTFNQIDHNGDPVNVWHIHGEARKPDSMIIGSDYYSRLTSRVIEETNKSERYDQKDGKTTSIISINSWVDALLFGDVYVLGFGYDYSEQDLWWLLNRKANETKIDKGKTYYYEPNGDERIRIKKSLLNVFGVETEGFDFGYKGKFDYKDFYKDAIDDIAKKVKQQKTSSD